MEAMPSGLELSTSQLHEINDILTRMGRSTAAQYVLLADITGQIIEAQGQSNQMDVAVLSAVAMGNLAATKEMARLVGEEAQFRLLVHEGRGCSVYLSDIEGELVLICVFPHTTPIGLIRLITRRAVEQLQRIVRETPSQHLPQDDLGADFERLLADELDLALGP